MSLSGLLAATIALVGATVHPGNAPPIENATVVFDGTRITAVGAGLAPPPGATVVDVKGRVVTPGLFESWTQLGLVEIEAIDETRDDDAGGDPIRAAHRIVDGYNADSEVIPVQRAHGITTAVVVPRGGLIAGQAAVYDLDATAPGAGLVNAEVGMVLSLGATGGPSRSAVLASVRELFDDARAYARNRAAWERNQYRPLSASYLDLDALQPVLKGEVPLLVSVARRADILAVLELARTQKVKVVLVGATEAWTLADVLAKAGVPVILDPVENAPENFDRLRARADAAAILEKAGVSVILSTFSTHNARKLRQWAGNAVREGMTHDGALAAITSVPARVFGLKDRGTLAAGQRAHVVVWSGDPFEPLTQVEQVYVDGRAVSLSHRQSRLVERYRMLPPAR
jgi:imidazolonepropionase-like amidohydrolase